MAKCNQDRGIRGEDHYATGWRVVVGDSHGEYIDTLCTKCCDRAKANGCEVRNATATDETKPHAP